MGGGASAKIGRWGILLITLLHCVTYGQYSYVGGTGFTVTFSNASGQTLNVVEVVNGVAGPIGGGANVSPGSEVQVTVPTLQYGEVIQLAADYGGGASSPAFPQYGFVPSAGFAMFITFETNGFCSSIEAPPGGVYQMSQIMTNSTTGVSAIITGAVAAIYGNAISIALAIMVVAVCVLYSKYPFDSKSMDAKKAPEDDDDEDEAFDKE